jgi:hypothetical protein
MTTSGNESQQGDFLTIASRRTSRKGDRTPNPNRIVKDLLR